MTTPIPYRIHQDTFQNALDVIGRWPEEASHVAQEYFRDNKDRLMAMDFRCFQELHTLLAIPEDPYYRITEPHTSADADFIASFCLLNVHFEELAETKNREERRTYLLNMLQRGDLVQWIELLRVLHSAVKDLNERGIVECDEQTELDLMDSVWNSWRRSSA
jgi:hypothetical protein